MSRRISATVAGVGIETADMLVQEVLSRQLRDRRAVARSQALRALLMRAAAKGEGPCARRQCPGAAWDDPTGLALSPFPEGQRIGPMVPYANGRRTRRHAQVHNRGGRRTLSGVRSVSSRSDAGRSVGLKVRIPRRMRHAFIRLTMLVCWLTKFSRSRFGRGASSSSRLGITAIWQWSGSPRSLPMRARFKCPVSSRSVLVRRCSRGTATLVAWITKPRPHAPVASAPAKNRRGRPKGDSYARDTVPKLCRLVAPAVQQPEQRVFVGAKLLQRMTIQAVDNSRDKPA